VSFFAPPPPAEPPEHPPRPPWLGPPENELGEAVAASVVLVKRSDLAIVVTDFRSYSCGIGGRLIVRIREREPGGRMMHPMHLIMHTRGTDPAELPRELLRFGIEFADGRRATTIDNRASRGDEPPEIALRQRGGSGGGSGWEFGFWIWPLPPEGSLTFAVEWPAESVELTTSELDPGPLLAAAARSEELWEPSERGDGDLGVTFQQQTSSTRTRVTPPGKPSET
jgi:hypothetical protein